MNSHCKVREEQSKEHKNTSNLASTFYTKLNLNRLLIIHPSFPKISKLFICIKYFQNYLDLQVDTSLGDTIFHVILDSIN